MTLIIRDVLVGPPTWNASFRDVTLFCNVFLRLDIVVETNGNPDMYWYWLKRYGNFDFVEDFVRTGSEDGVRLDIEPNFPRTIITDRIVPENTHLLIGKIKSVSSI